MNWQDFGVQLKGMKHYFIAAAATLLAGIYLGYSSPEQFQFLLESQKQQLLDIINSMMAKDHYQWRLMLYVFANNILVAVFMVYSGALFGIIPLFSLMSNGLMIGYLAHQYVPEEGWSGFLMAILPHGIFEYPALLLACAYGIKFGALTLKGLIFLPSPSRRAANSKTFIHVLKNSILLMVVLAVLFFAAALIEGLVT